LKFPGFARISQAKTPVIPKIRAAHHARQPKNRAGLSPAPRPPKVFSEKKCCNTAASLDNDGFIYTIFINQKKE